MRFAVRRRWLRRRVAPIANQVFAAWPTSPAPVHVLAATAAFSILVALALLPGPFSTAHGFAVVGALLSLLAVHRALLQAEIKQPDDVGRLTEFGQRLERRIEQLKDLQWEISENESRCRDLLDSQDDMILRRDGSDRLTFVNRAFCRAFGLDADEAIGSEFRPTVLAADGPQRSEVIGERRRRQFLQEIATSAGPRWIEWEEQDVPSPAGDGDEVQCIGRDVTERRRARAELEEARDRAEAASRAKSRFLATMSHEIRTPMNGILGMASLLLESCDTLDEQTYARAIDQSARNLLVIIDEILDYSKIEAGKLLLSEQPFRIEGTIQSAVELLAPRAHEKGLEIAWSVATDAAIPIAGDEARVRQILLNLVSNAVKFTDTGGVLISARCLSDARREPGTVRMMVSVQDSGIGLSEEDKKRLFDEFEQADAAIKRQSGGTGLGLAISQRLALAMGGDIHVTSSPGKGSTFFAELEFRSIELPDAAVGEAPADLGPMHVLLAFDRAMERKSLAATLVAGGIPTLDVPFAEAQRAVKDAALSGRPVDRVVVEVSADPVAAAELLAAARRHLVAAGRAAADLRGIVLVNVLSRSSLAAFRAHGFAAYLVRPVRPNSLLEQLGARPRDVLVTNRAVDAPASDLASAAVRPRVLLAEDNDINELLARRILEKCGCEVVSVRNGSAAVAAVRASLSGSSGPFDLVLMDILMPEMDGVEATRAIKALDADVSSSASGSAVRPLPPIVALTANAFPEDRLRYLDAGMDDYLAKPFDKQAIEGVLVRWLAAGKARSDSANSNAAQSSSDGRAA
ncbi:MAG: ATP-binding protein [Hyphomicrobium sp.]